METATSISYKHTEKQLDPRDQHAVTWSPSSRRFIAESSTLHAMGIEPFHYVDPYQGKGSWRIWLWSEKHQRSVLYIMNKALQIRDSSGEDVIADVFVPLFDANNPASRAAQGTQLHILND